MADTPVTLTHELGQNTNNGDNMFGTGGGSWIWIILLFILFGFGGGGFGNNRANTNTVIGLTNEALLLQLNQNLSTQFAGVNQGICNLRSDIAGVNYNAAVNYGNLTHQGDMNTCAIKNAIHEDGNATRALINANTMQELRERLSVAENAIANANQTAQIISAIRPYPVQSVPFAPYNSFGGECFGHRYV